MFRHSTTRGAAALLLTIALVAACGSSSKKPSATSNATTATMSSAPVRGFDGSTITIAGAGLRGQLPGIEWGVKARVQRFNDTNELPGIKINYTEFADDKQDPATALSEARRLVTDTKVFAMVGQFTANNPATYLTQQKVPTFGYGADGTFCSSTVTKDLWMFGWTGCLVPVKPTVLPDIYGLAYKYAVQQTGKQHPTIADFSGDNDDGRNVVRFGADIMKGDGFTVVFAKGILPTVVTDYAPFVQQLLTADGGKAPDVIYCGSAVQCIPMYTQLMASGYKGIFLHPLWSDLIAKPMKGSLLGMQFANPSDPSPAMDKVRADLKAVKPDQAVDLGVLSGYFSAAQFIDALKIAAKSGKQNITPEGVQRAAATMTFEIPGLVGPTKFPEATAQGNSCQSLSISDGTAWKTITPYTCSTRTFKVTS